MEVDLLAAEMNGSFWEECFVNALFSLSGTICELGVRGLGDDLSLAMLKHCFELAGSLERNPIGCVTFFECDLDFLMSLGQFRSLFLLFPKIRKIQCTNFDAMYLLRDCHLLEMAINFLDTFRNDGCDRDLTVETRYVDPWHSRMSHLPRQDEDALLDNCLYFFTDVSKIIYELNSQCELIENRKIFGFFLFFLFRFWSRFSAALRYGRKNLN